VPDRTKPFRSEIVLETIKVAFFGSGGTGLKHPASFKSSLSIKPNEREIPPSMVALAMTTV
jgi:hypothetical protein